MTAKIFDFPKRVKIESVKATSAKIISIFDYKRKKRLYKYK